MNEDFTQQLQNKVDTIKTLSTINNAHNLTPPVRRDEDERREVLIISALSSQPRIAHLFLEMRGKMWDENERKIIEVSEPIMNVNGAAKLVSELKKIAGEAEWSNFEQENIPSYVDHFFKSIFPYFTFWHEDYELDPRNFDYVAVTLQMFILASFYKAKGGKYLNVLGKTYSEDTLLKGLGMKDGKKRQEGFLERYNPFKKFDQ